MPRALVILVLCVSHAAAVAAQVGSGAITGVVTDQQGAAVPGATVAITSAATERQRVLVSNQDGVFAAGTLTPGEYRVDVTLTGFKPVAQSGVRITTGETMRLDVQLIAGNVREQVTVSASPAPLRSDTASLGATIGNQGVVGLPLNGRTFITLAQLAPGVALPPGSQLPRINGGRPRTNEYLFDGISVLQPEPGQVAYFPVIDAIEEFRVETNSPPAEFGRFNGGVINLTTRSGSNTFSGNVFEFLRHEDLNARNFFQSSGPKPEYRRSQFGGTAGGPIQRNRTFFFADYQGQRQTIGRTVISTVPTLLQRQGIFTEPIAGKVPTIFDPSSGSVRTPFAGNTIPAGQIDSVALSLIQRYPLPTSTGTSNNFRRTAPETDNQDQGDVRLDHAITNRDHIFGRLTYFHDDFVPVTPLPDGSGVTTGTLGPQKTSSWAFAGQYQHTFSSQLVNELRFGD
ncbi:MAG TPA: carboxypeptidase-like regulatory domain-containing protein, partial [Vicinamibacterales bacterium]|nr:carboxypeptidase-like regulatory domain-containing protein [Vicinamibacterales bacterium]